MGGLAIKTINIKHIFLVIGILILATNLCGCLNNSQSAIKVSEQDKFIGTWKQQFKNEQSGSQTYIFYENYTFLSIYIEPYGIYHEGTGDFTLDDNNIICMKTHPHGAITDDDAYCYEYEFSDDNTQMILTNINLPTVTLNRIK